MDTTFDELGIDSLDRINILFELENEFDIGIPDERARSINSVNGIVVQLADYLQQEQDGRV
jgi:acyl carrier protein